MQLEDYASKIEAEKVYYLETLEGLLADIVQSEHDLDLLLQDPTGSAWQEPMYEPLLQERLGRSYVTFVEVRPSLHTIGDLLSREERVPSWLGGYAPLPTLEILHF